VLATATPRQLRWRRIRSGLYFSGTEYGVMQEDWHDWQVYRVSVLDDWLRYDYVNLGGYFPSARAAKDAKNRYVTVKNEVAAINRKTSMASLLRNGPGCYGIQAILVIP
jgi:hypothetical protein